MPFPDGHPHFCRYDKGPSETGWCLVDQGDKESNRHCVYLEGKLFAELPKELDARRFVACWNLLHNVPVQMMEEWIEEKKINPNATHFSSLPVLVKAK